MSFIRTKKIKGQVYAYVVENLYRKRGNRVKQKTKKYLGKVYDFEKINSVEFNAFHNIEDVRIFCSDKSLVGLLIDLVKVELFNHGFTEKKKDIWSFNECVVRLNPKKVENIKGNPVALAFNEGYLTGYALRKIINFKAYEDEDGYLLAKMFVEAGIAIPQDVFVEFFKKSLKN